MLLTLAETLPSMASPWLWGGFIVFMLIAMWVDLGLGGRMAMSTRSALRWCAVWIALALVFNAWLYFEYGGKVAGEFLAGYVTEKSLSVDNLFVFVLVFAFFKTPPHLQHRALVWGIIGAMIMRAVMILAGVALIQRFHFMIAIFGAFLVVSGIKMAFHDEDTDPSKSWWVKWLQKKLPLTDGYREEHFFVHENGKRMVTRLFLVLLVIELSDVIFAIDSIPAILGLTQDPFIVFTSNMFAILGLRALYFALAGAMQQLRYLGVGLSLILSFIGLKMLAEFVPAGMRAVGIATELKGEDLKLPIEWSLLVVVAILAVTIGASLLLRPAPAEPEPKPEPEDLVSRSSRRYLTSSSDDVEPYGDDPLTGPPAPQPDPETPQEIEEPVEKESGA